MPESNENAVKSDMKPVVKNAQDLLHEASAATGAKVDELCAKGLGMLDGTLSKMYEVKTSTVKAGREVAACTDEYVNEHPWRAVALSAGVGLLVGLLATRR